MNGLYQWFQVIRREVRIMRKRPIYLLGSVGVMAASALFFLTFMGEGLPQKLPIGVVDLDQSSTSRNFREELDATQLGRVVDFESVSASYEKERFSTFINVSDIINSFLNNIVIYLLWQ